MAAKTNHKRKGDFVDSSHVVRVNVESGGNADNPLQALKAKLQQRRNVYLDASEDPLLKSMSVIRNDDDLPVQNMKQTSSRIQADLDRQIAIANEACQLESGALADLSNTLQTLQASRDKLLQDMDEVDQRQLDLQHQIALHQQETSEEMDVIDSVEEERKREVPRLKHAISLYASTTGIKWDFLQEDAPSGSVVSPSLLSFLLWNKVVAAHVFRLHLCRPCPIVKVSSCSRLIHVTMTQ